MKFIINVAGSRVPGTQDGTVSPVHMGLRVPSTWDHTISTITSHHQPTSHHHTITQLHYQMASLYDCSDNDDEIVQSVPSVTEMWQLINMIGNLDFNIISDFIDSYFDMEDCKLLKGFLNYHNEPTIATTRMRSFMLFFFPKSKLEQLPNDQHKLILQYVKPILTESYFHGFQVRSINDRMFEENFHFAFRFSGSNEQSLTLVRSKDIGEDIQNFIIRFNGSGWQFSQKIWDIKEFAEYVKTIKRNSVPTLAPILGYEGLVVCNCINCWNK